MLILVLGCLTAGAQQKQVKGYLLDSITHFAVTNGTVTNGTTGTKTTTDTSGFFSIDAAVNDFLYALAPAFHYDTLSVAYLFSDTIIIYLSPLDNVLPNVLVTSIYTKYQLDSIKRKSNFLDDRGQTLETISTQKKEGFGLTVNLDRLFKSKYSNKRNQQQLFDRTEQSAYINYRFSPLIVTTYSGLKGEALRAFMYKYQPSYKWLKANKSNEDVLFYINEKLKLYKQK